MQNITEHIDALLRAMPPITLEQMSEIRLMKRTDQKYLTNLPTLLRLLEMTRESYYSQEIEGRRISMLVGRKERVCLLI